MEIVKLCALYVASLKAMALIHTHNHWVVKDHFYGNHLLFERIYKTALEDLDTAAEKFVGVFGPECLNWELQTSLLNKVLSKYNKLSSSPIQMSLAIEMDFLNLSQTAYKTLVNTLKEKGEPFLGMDDMLMAIASNREVSVYLLKQANEE